MPNCTATPSLSVVTTTDPIAGHLPELLRKLSALALSRDELFEVVIVDDLKHWAEASQIQLEALPGLQLRPVWYPEHRGQLDAMLGGIKLVCGNRILTIDPDMHACIAEIPGMLDRMTGEVAIVHGIRSRRQDTGLLRQFGSALANFIARRITGIRMTDLGSPVALMRAPLINPVLTAAGTLRNPRLFLYASLGSALIGHKLHEGTPANSPSQYRAVTLLPLFFRLIRDSVEVRHTLNAAKK